MVDVRDAPIMEIAMTHNRRAMGYAMMPIRTIQAMASSDRDLMSSKFRSKAKLRIGTMPLSTVSNAAVGGGVFWVPTRSRTLPLAAPQA